jgi:hypothetical protein
MFRLLLSIIVLLSTMNFVYALSCCKCKDNYVPSSAVSGDSKTAPIVCSSLCQNHGGYSSTYTLRESPTVNCGTPCSNSESSCYRPGQRICDDTSLHQENKCVESTDFKCVTLEPWPWPRCKTECSCDNWTGGGLFGGKGHTTSDEDCSCALLVTLDYFGTIVYTDKSNCYVILKWETATEIDTVGFNIWRAQVKNGEYVNITKVNNQLVGIKAKNDYQGASYSYEDHDVVPGNTYYYVLEDIDFAGLSTVHYDFLDSATVQPPLAISP